MRPLPSFTSAYLGFLAPKAPLDAPFGGLAITWRSQRHQRGMGVGLADLGPSLAIPRARRGRAARLNGRIHFSKGVIVGVAVVAVTGWLVLVPIVAVRIGINILWSGICTMIRAGAAGAKRPHPKWWHVSRK